MYPKQNNNSSLNENLISLKVEMFNQPVSIKLIYCGLWRFINEH